MKTNTIAATVAASLRRVSPYAAANVPAAPAAVKSTSATFSAVVAERPAT